LDYVDLQRRLSETQKLLKETKESKLKLEAEVEKLSKRSSFQRSWKKRLFTLNNFIYFFLSARAGGTF